LIPLPLSNSPTFDDNTPRKRYALVSTRAMSKYILRLFKTGHMQSQGSTILLIGQESHVDPSRADPVVRLQAPQPRVFDLPCCVAPARECGLQLAGHYVPSCGSSPRVLHLYMHEFSALSWRLPSSWSSWSLTAARLIQRNTPSLSDDLFGHTSQPCAVLCFFFS
jgi:hypothetical protein